MSRQHVIKDRTLELGVGVVLFLAGAYLIRDAYENRGKRRPFPASIVLP